MKRLTLLAALLLPFIQVGAQHATILTDELVYELSSPVSGQYSVHRKVLVHNEKGLPTAAFWEFTDAFHSMASFSGSITYQGKSRKIKKDDLINHSLTDGLADDAAICLYQPSSPYPFTVEYDYTVSCKKGIASFPTFLPLDRENVSLVGASYTLIVPAGFAIQYFASAEPVVEKGKTDRYQWKFAMPDGFREEHLMPSFLTFVPYVYASPVEFSYGGKTGSQRNWKDIGLWLYGLQEGAQDLPDEAVAKFREMTKDCKTPEEKVAVLYRYLRDNTRYVSIQLGIGGLKPFPASTVYKSGFGDCKALSNFLRAALAAVGVESDYYAVSTSHATLFPGYVSIGQMNHVMLAVPLKEHRDTLWVECTNPAGVPARGRGRPRGTAGQAGRGRTGPGSVVSGFVAMQFGPGRDYGAGRWFGLAASCQIAAAGPYGSLSGLFVREAGRPGADPHQRVEPACRESAGAVHQG